jgi:hypothetical protein
MLLVQPPALPSTPPSRARGHAPHKRSIDIDRCPVRALASSGALRSCRHGRARMLQRAQQLRHEPSAAVSRRALNVRRSLAAPPRRAAAPLATFALPQVPLPLIRRAATFCQEGWGGRRSRPPHSRHLMPRKLLLGRSRWSSPLKSRGCARRGSRTDSDCAPATGLRLTPDLAHARLAPLQGGPAMRCLQCVSTRTQLTFDSAASAALASTSSAQRAGPVTPPRTSFVMGAADP